MRPEAKAEDEAEANYETLVGRGQKPWGRDRGQTLKYKLILCSVRIAVTFNLSWIKLTLKQVAQNSHEVTRGEGALTAVMLNYAGKNCE